MTEIRVTIEIDGRRYGQKYDTVDDRVAPHLIGEQVTQSIYTALGMDYPAQRLVSES
jgi:hypothetical protein